MTALQLFPTAWTPTFFIRDRNIPILSFFGRPGDPRKGLVTFLDALCILLRLGHVPPFSVWLVGGSDDEIDLIGELFESRPPLGDCHARGSITVWGRVATAALPELYSRSSVTVVPSSREQFGIVAIEAMSCGSPVIATRVGGLADIVLRSYTGTLLATDDPSALANALLGYLRNPDRVRREGTNAVRWTRQAFTHDVAFSNFNRLYEGGDPPVDFPDRSRMRRDDLAEVKVALEAFLGGSVTLHDVSSSDHTSTLVDCEDGGYFCKWYRPEQANNLTVLPVRPELRHERTLAYYAGRLRFHADNPLVPRVLRLPNPEQPFALFERCRPAGEAEVRHQLKRITNGFRSHRSIGPDDADGQRYLRALSVALASPTLEAISEHDLAAAALNRRLSDGGPRFQHVHPHIELLRLGLLLRDDAWAVSADVKQRLGSTIAFLLDHSQIPLEMPKLCHGSLKPAHFLLAPSGSLVVCDIDGSRYAVGPVDEVHHVLSDVPSSRSFALASSLTRLTQLSDSADELSLATCWLFVFLIYEALLTGMKGGDIRQARAIRICRDLPYAWRRIVTQSR